MESPDNKVQDPELGLYPFWHSNTISFNPNSKGLYPDLVVSPVVQVQELGVGDEVEGEQAESLMTLEGLEGLEVPKVLEAQCYDFRRLRSEERRVGKEC